VPHGGADQWASIDKPRACGPICAIFLTMLHWSLEADRRCTRKRPIEELKAFKLA
jgi:hypothetical protein